MIWTPEQKDTLRDLAAEKFTADEIALKMGVTRNAIIGICHRNKIQLHGVLFGANRPKEPRSYGFRLPRRAPRALPPPITVAPPLAPAPSPVPVPALAPAPANPISLLDLTNETCRWPISDDGEPYMFCGALEAGLGERIVYCRVHARMAYRRPGQAA
jgi:GcrA cell cycle regulator